MSDPRFNGKNYPLTGLKELPCQFIVIDNGYSVYVAEEIAELVTNYLKLKAMK